MSWYRTKAKIEKNKTEKYGQVFCAFERWRKNLQLYFFVDKESSNTYIFKFGYSKEGGIIENNNNKHLEIMEHDAEFYIMFIKKVKSMTKKWKRNNYSKTSIEGSKWGIHCKDEDIEYESISYYPENYDEVFNLIAQFFNSKYIMKKGTEDNEHNKAFVEEDLSNVQFLYGPPPFEVIKLEKDISSAQDANDSIASLDDIFGEDDKEDKVENIDKEVNKRQCLYGPPPFRKEKFEDYIDKDFEDPFLKELVFKYFKEYGPLNEMEKIREYNNLRIYEDVFNEFTKYLVQRNYDIKDALEIKGYTAKKISELYPKLNAISIYKIMAKLIENPENAENIINNIKD